MRASELDGLKAGHARQSALVQTASTDRTIPALQGVKVASSPRKIPVEKPDPAPYVPWRGNHAIPKSWIWVRVDQVGTVRVGRQQSPKHRQGRWQTPYIRAANITWTGLDLTDVLRMDFYPADREVYRLRKGDVVLSEASGSPEQVGKPALWDDALPLCCFQNTVIRFRPAHISSEYALAVFRYLAETGLMATFVRGVGIAHLGSDRFAQIAFPLPPLREQERIVDRLDSVFARLERVRDSLGRATSNLEIVSTATLRDALNGSLPELENTKPHSWPRVRLSDVCDVVNGRAFKRSEWSETGLPIIRIQNLKDTRAPFNYFSGEVDDRHLVKRGDLLFAWSGTPGSSFGAFIWQGETGALNQHIFKLSFDQTAVDAQFLCFALNGALDHFVSLAQGGGGLAHLSRGNFLATELLVPHISIQRTVVRATERRLNTLAAQHELLSRAHIRLKDLRSSTLHRAVTGRLVPQSPTEGHATETAKSALAEIAREEQSLAELLHTLSDASDLAVDAPIATKNVVQALRDQGPLNAGDLFALAGFSQDSSSDPPEFYRQLDAALRTGVILLDADSAKGTVFRMVSL